jgi:hypothetical protein
VARSIAINVAANTNLPGFRGPIYPDGSFVYIPIPERKSVSNPVPTYVDLLDKLDPLPFAVEDDVGQLPVHLDPEFAGYPGCSRYTYGDEHGVKAGPLAELEPGDSLYFYATLSRHEPPSTLDTGPPVDWVAPDWGGYLIGEFRVDRVFDSETCRNLSEADRRRVASNAHCKRDPFDAKVLVVGGSGSKLFDRAVPLSTPESGSTANWLVTDLSNGSGKGPWWRRQLWFDDESTETLRAIVDGTRSV